MPVDRAWAELIVNAEDDLLPYLAVMSSIESLHRMTRDERDLSGLIVSGSDHLTAYNLYAEAYERAGYVGEVYGLARHLFESEAVAKWADERGVLVKAIEDAALATASLFRGVKLPLPSRMPVATEGVLARFTDLLAEVMPFDLVIDEQTSDGQSARVSKSSMCGNRGAIAGSLRYFADRSGISRAAVEGTQISIDKLRRHARRDAAELDYSPRRKHAPLVLKWKLEYFGFILESSEQAIKEFSPKLASSARRVLAQAVARGDAQHIAVHKNRDAIEEVRALYRRSGGSTPRLGFDELTAHYEMQLSDQEVNSLEEFRDANLGVKTNDFVPKGLRAQLWNLPAHVWVRDREVEIDYDVEENETGKLGVARLRLPEKLARTLTSHELPILDRPLRFVVARGQRGATRANTLEELQEMLEGPWTPNVLVQNMDAQQMDLSVEKEEDVQRKPREARPRHRAPKGGGRNARGGFPRGGPKRGRKAR